jgi:hypothetical protein
VFGSRSMIKISGSERVEGTDKWKKLYVDSPSTLMLTKSGSMKWAVCSTHWIWINTWRMFAEKLQLKGPLGTLKHGTMRWEGQVLYEIHLYSSVMNASKTQWALTVHFPKFPLHFSIFYSRRAESWAVTLVRWEMCRKCLLKYMNERMLWITSHRWEDSIKLDLKFSKFSMKV